MQPGIYRKNIIVLFIIGITFILLTAFAFWNAFINPDKALGITPIIFCLFSILAVGLLFSISLKLTDSKAFNEYIDLKVSEGRSALISELKKEEESTEVKINTEEELATAKKLIPEGNIKKLDAFSNKLLTNLSKQLELVQGIVYQKAGKTKNYKFIAGYALTNEEPLPDIITGEGITGEAVQSQEIMIVEQIPESYLNVASGLGQSKPAHLMIVPIINNKITIIVIELASFVPFDGKKIQLMKKFSEIVANNFKQLIKA